MPTVLGALYTPFSGQPCASHVGAVSGFSQCPVYVVFFGMRLYVARAVVLASKVAAWVENKTLDFLCVEGDWSHMQSVDMITLLNERLAALQPTHLHITDDSEHHAGHAAMRGLKGGVTHVSITITSPLFDGKKQLERHRMVNEAISDLFAMGLHAVQITARVTD